MLKVLGWQKSPYGFFHKIKDTFFICTSNFIDLDILSMLALSLTNFFFFAFQLHFYLFWNNKAQYTENGMIAVTIQSNKIASNEVKDN